MGSKAKIANQLMCKMLSIVPKAKYFVDLFGGGGAMSFCALQHGLKVVYNEKQTSLAEFLQYIVDRASSGQRSRFGLFPEEWYNFVNREDFIKQKDLQTPYSQFVRICYSFGNNQRSYAFSRDIELNKKLGHDIVMFQCVNSLKQFNERNEVNFTISNSKTWNERGLNFKTQWNDHMKRNPVVIDMIVKGIVSNKTQIVPKVKAIWLQDGSVQQLEQLQQLGRLGRLQQLQQLQRLEQLKQLEQLQQLGRLGRLQQLEQLEQLEPFTILNLDYKDVIFNTPIDETVVYLDPPYRGTAKYLEKDTLSAEIDNFFQNHPYTCFMSEYNTPFNPIMTIEKMQTLQNKTITKDNSIRQEKLYINKPLDSLVSDYISMKRILHQSVTTQPLMTAELF
jgi:site-specific DNA-adenine methylase